MRTAECRGEITFAAKGDILEVSCTSADDVEVAVPPHRHDVRNPAACTYAYEAAQQSPSPRQSLRHPWPVQELGLPKYRALLHRSGRMTVRWCHPVSRVAVFALRSNILIPRRDVKLAGGNVGEKEAVSDVVGSINRDSQSLSSLSRSSGQFRREYLSRTIFIRIHTKRGAHTATAHRDMGPNEHKPSMVRRRLDPHPCILSTRLQEMGPVSMGHSLK
ncbi:hypothetical protein NA56DRAFT_699277 [Hyaloscypha hepaticicola]|uniref:Uncharacterized protein n=1 Tax=Hyaloscypha hepaticicola TaxID=2082293 RepID=A0A2J6QGI8_9HELO|nr:hypothetical protein NA56DRAFT_699277 [Hyaloscypha hepaticicola]